MECNQEFLPGAPNTFIAHFGYTLRCKNPRSESDLKSITVPHGEMNQIVNKDGVESGDEVRHF